MIPALAAVAATAIAAFWYLRQEEPVRGRSVAAVLRAGALFLLFAGLWMPGLPRPSDRKASSIALVDVSMSMSLPATEGGSATRLDSALAMLPNLAPNAVFTFGTEVTGPLDGLSSVERAEEPGSRAARAVETAALAGADSVWIITDGDLDDREQVVGAAERVGIGVREIRVAEARTRVGIVDIDHALAAEAGDTLRVTVSLGSVEGSGPLPDSATIRVTSSDGTETRARVPVPSPGRLTRTTVGVLAPPSDADEMWQLLDVRLEAGADPLGVADRASSWVQVTPAGAGAVLIALDPDWEAGYLAPVLERSTVGGVRVYARVAQGRFVRVGAEPAVAAGEAEVRRAAEGAALLVLQSGPEALPGWLVRLANQAPAVLFLVRGGGSLAGTPAVAEPLPAGEWYVSPVLPPSPLAGLLAGLQLDELPPLSPLYAAGGTWSPLQALRDRRGEPRPIVVAGSAGERRWGAVLAQGTWRWAARGGAARQAYRSLYGGLAGWLLDAGDGERIRLADPAPGAEAPIRWRIAPGVSDLAVTVQDSLGNVVWSEAVESADAVLIGPTLPPGVFKFESVGARANGQFRAGRPFTVHPARGEIAPRANEPLISIVAADAESGGPRRRPIWPFVLAGALLCAEWLWRRRIGLR